MWLYDMGLAVDPVSHKCDARRGQDGYLVSVTVVQLDNGHDAVCGGWVVVLK